MNMKSLVPWGKNRNVDTVRHSEGASPFLALHREMNRVFDDFLSDFGTPSRMGSAWPHIELSETEDKLKVVAELPGLEERDVDVTLQDGVLTLKGHKKVEENGRFRVRERTVLRYYARAIEHLLPTPASRTH